CCRGWRRSLASKETSIMTTEQIAAYVIDHFEGHSYVDDPVDTGGATKFGITLRTLQHYRRLRRHDPSLIVTKNDMRNLTHDEAVSIAVEMFAEETKIDEILDWRV